MVLILVLVLVLTFIPIGNSPSIIICMSTSLTADISIIFVCRLVFILIFVFILFVIYVIYVLVLLSVLGLVLKRIYIHFLL